MGSRTNGPAGWPVLHQAVLSVMAATRWISAAPQVSARGDEIYLMRVTEIG